MGALQPNHFLTKSGQQLVGLTERDCLRGFARAVAPAGTKIDKLLIRNCKALGTGSNVSPNLPAGIDLRPGTSGRIENVEVAKWMMPGDYYQGDGILCETGADDWILVKVKASDCGDAAFDYKSFFRGRDCTGARAKRPFKFWNDVKTSGKLTSIDPTNFGGTGSPAHIWLNPNGGRRTIDIAHWVARAKEPWPLILLEGTGHVDIIIRAHTLEVPKGTPLFRKATSKATYSLHWQQGEPAI